MNDKLDQLIGNEHRRICGIGRGLHYPVMSGVVTAVDSDGMTCTVQLTVDAEGTPTDGVLMNVVLENTNGMYLLPAVNAHCVVAEVDGPGQLKQMLWASSYTKVVVTVGSSQLTVENDLIQLNDGSKNGIPVSGDLVTRLNKVEEDLNNLKEVFTGWTPVTNDGGAALKTAAATWYAATLTETVIDDIQNTKVTQG